jgi:hypothetical protein
MSRYDDKDSLDPVGSFLQDRLQGDYTPPPSPPLAYFGSEARMNDNSSGNGKTALLVALLIVLLLVILFQVNRARPDGLNYPNLNREQKGELLARVIERNYIEAVGGDA